MSISKKTLLNLLEQQVEQHLKETIQLFQNLDEKILLQSSKNGGWSIAQCLEHLNSYGRYYLPQLKKALALQNTAPDKSTFKSTWLGNYFIKMMRSETNKKYKAAKIHTPPAQLDPHQVVSEFIGQLEELMLYIRQAQTADIDAVKIPISIARWIRLKPGDVLQFIIAHNTRHLLQAKRNIQ